MRWIVWLTLGLAACAGEGKTTTASGETGATGSDTETTGCRRGCGSSSSTPTGDTGA